eukprot:m.18613 g.18613  ORF g.18613 m.18613 type:complete len:116 (+) comp9703_c0_seq1:2949-3296(+)
MVGSTSSTGSPRTAAKSVLFPDPSSPMTATVASAGNGPLLPRWSSPPLKHPPFASSSLLNVNIAVTIRNGSELAFPLRLARADGLDSNYINTRFLGSPSLSDIKRLPPVPLLPPE